MFFTASNPGIENGGLMMESKWRIHRDAPEGFFPHTLGIDPKEPFATVAEKVLQSFHFPFIAKPDIGSRGSGVALIRTIKAFEQYHADCPIAYIVQEWIDMPGEAGIFYVKLPGEGKGRITGIVEKKFITVKGNGKNTIRDLLAAEPRYFLQLPTLEQIIDKNVLSSILPEGIEQQVIAIGNHARGSLFLNASDKITPQLEAVINEWCERFPGFNFGRLDIRFVNWERLTQGLDFVIIELNGAGSEPTHIYDPSQSIFFAWKEIMRHWRLLYVVSTDQHRKGIPYLSFREMIRLIRVNATVEKKVRAMKG